MTFGKNIEQLLKNYNLKFKRTINSTKRSGENKDLIESNISSTSFESLSVAFSPDYPHKTACIIFKMTTLVSSLPSKESKTIGAFATFTVNYKNSTIKTLIWLVGERCKLILNKGMGHTITLTVYLSLSGFFLALSKGGFCHWFYPWTIAHAPKCLLLVTFVHNVGYPPFIIAQTSYTCYLKLESSLFLLLIFFLVCNFLYWRSYHIIWMYCCCMNVMVDFFFSDVKLLFIKNVTVQDMFVISLHGFAKHVKHLKSSGSAAFVL